MPSAMRVFATLFRKELRGLRAWAALFVAVFFGLSIFDDLLKIVDQSSLQAMVSSFDPSLAELTFLLTFTMGLSLPSSEHDNGTIAFLDMLPTTRGLVYAAKVAAGLVVLLVLPLADLAEQIPHSFFSRTSIDQHVHVALFASLDGLHYAAAVTGFSTGMALSLARRVAWAALAVVVVLVVQLERVFPALSQWKPSALLSFTLHGERLAWPTGALLRQGAGCAVLLVAGGVLFAAAGEGLASTFSLGKRGRVAGVIVTAVVVVSWLVAFAVAEGPTAPPPPPSGPVPGATFKRAPPVHVITARYDFNVRGNLDDHERAQILGADAVADAVIARFAKAGGDDCASAGRITVDATRPLGAERNAGQTEWTTVAVDAGVVGRDDFVEVIAHETAHVCENVISRRHMSEKHRYTRTVNEGLATVIGEDVARRAVPRFARVAAFAHARDLVSPDILFDDDALLERVDPNLAYALGAELVRATIDVAGGDDTAPIRAVAALDLVNKDETGLTLWRDAYQRAGQNLDRVLERFGARLEDEARAQAPLLAALPRAFASVEQSTGREVWVRVSFDGDLADNAKPACQARRDDRVALEEMISVLAVDGVCHIPSALLPGKADVQVGYILDDDVGVFEAWTTVTF